MRRLLLIVPAALLLACTEQNPVGSLSSYNITSPPPSARDITVMTQNLYVGADVDLVIRALGTPDPGDDFPALMFAIATVGKTDFPARAEAIADEIARARPHAVGFQEVSKIDIDLTPLGAPAVIHQDFLAILQSALAARGLHYTVAGTSDNINVSLVSGLVRLVDHDALLVDADRVTINEASAQDFSVNLGQVAAGVVLIRGYARIEHADRADGRLERHAGVADVRRARELGIHRHVGRAPSWCGWLDLLPRGRSVRSGRQFRSAHRLRVDARLRPRGRQSHGLHRSLRQRAGGSGGWASVPHLAVRSCGVGCVAALTA